MRITGALITGLLLASPIAAETAWGGAPGPETAAQHQKDAQLDMLRSQMDAKEAQRDAAQQKFYKAQQFQSDSRIEAQDAQHHQKAAGSAQADSR